MRKLKITLTAILMTTVLTGCMSAVLMGKDLLPQAEIEGILTGNTWAWNDGGGLYFGQGGNAIVNWKGENHETQWWAEDGKFCYKGKKDRCWGLFLKDGEIYSASLWQPEYSKPYRWNPDEKLTRGRRF